MIWLKILFRRLGNKPHILIQLHAATTSAHVRFSDPPVPAAPAHFSGGTLIADPFGHPKRSKLGSGGFITQSRPGMILGDLYWDIQFGSGCTSPGSPHRLEA